MYNLFVSIGFSQCQTISHRRAEHYLATRYLTTMHNTLYICVYLYLCFFDNLFNRLIMR